jgi:glycine cleavage system H protein
VTLRGFKKKSLFLADQSNSVYFNSIIQKDMNVPSDLLYTKDHEWLRIEGDFGYVGITGFAQGELGDIVFLEIETLGETLEKEEVFGTIEAVKTVSDMFMPVGGEIVEVNPELEESPDLVNKDPYGKGWMIKIKITDPSETITLLSAEKYQELL